MMRRAMMKAHIAAGMPLSIVKTDNHPNQFSFNQSKDMRKRIYSRLTKKMMISVLEKNSIMKFRSFCGMNDQIAKPKPNMVKKSDGCIG